MKTVAILSQKGGCGKSMLAIQLAVASELGGHPAAIVDLDPQISSTGWAEHRTRLFSKSAPAVVSFQAARLPQALQAASQGGASLTILDTAPHSEQDSLSAARAADIVLIPCRPGILDLRAIRFTIDLAALAHKPATVVLNAVTAPRSSAHTSQADKAAEAIRAEYQIPVCPIRVAQRADYAHALASGLGVQEYAPDSKAAQEIAALYKWMRKQLGERN